MGASRGKVQRKVLTSQVAKRMGSLSPKQTRKINEGSDGGLDAIWEACAKELLEIPSLSLEEAIDKISEKVAERYKDGQNEDFKSFLRDLIVSDKIMMEELESLFPSKKSD